MGFLYEIPKTKSGKINKDKIKEIFSTNLSYPFVLDVQTSKTFKKITLMFEKSSNFFKGHFENYPITPGVVQLYYAQKFGACFAPCFEFNSVKRVKFSNIIKPDEIVNLNFEITEKGLKYTYSNENTVYSSGLFSKKEI